MQSVSATYTTILSGKHRAEWKVQIDGTDYGESVLESIKISSGAFGSYPALGSCISAEIEIKMLKPVATFSRMAQIKPYVRIKNATQTSEWLPKGIFYIDTRETSKNGGVERLTIHGYDAMLKAECDAPISGFPKTDKNTVNQIASQLGLTVDTGTLSAINRGYTIQMPAEYSSREVLGYIAAAYGGCFIIDDDGHLRLVRVNGFPAETNYLINTAGLAITFGGDRILV